VEVSGQFHALAILPHRKKSPVPIGYEDGWTPEPVWMLWKRKKSLPCQEWNPDLIFGFGHTKSLIVIVYIFVTHHHTNFCGQHMTYGVLMPVNVKIMVF
jgi:hypothetical protein